MASPEELNHITQKCRDVAGTRGRKMPPLSITIPTIAVFASATRVILRWSINVSRSLEKQQQPIHIPHAFHFSTSVCCVLLCGPPALLPHWGDATMTLKCRRFVLWSIKLASTLQTDLQILSLNIDERRKLESHSPANNASTLPVSPLPWALHSPSCPPRTPLLAGYHFAPSPGLQPSSEVQFGRPSTCRRHFFSSRRNFCHPRVPFCTSYSCFSHSPQRPPHTLVVPGYYFASSPGPQASSNICLSSSSTCRRHPPSFP